MILEVLFNGERYGEPAELRGKQRGLINECVASCNAETVGRSESAIGMIGIHKGRSFWELSCEHELNTGTST